MARGRRDASNGRLPRAGELPQDHSQMETATDGARRSRDRIDAERDLLFHAGKRHKRATFEMSKGQWSKPISDRTAARRAGGRRRYNTKRKREMWRRRFAILRIYAMLEDDPPHGIQQALAERFDVDKATVSRDVAWVESTGLARSGFSPLKCSYRRGAVSIEWNNTAPLLIVRAAKTKWLKAALRDAGAE